ncbi:hypothetical protein G9C98_005822 [Cotesia typhae]|uniref:Uncharacterized protein n=1 Tax=Cotesia typhae TaxID=2053667 RepID=A0A8J5R9M6_9HYME|nr:hypothetical protein G9C98_005822 [Cotesia typhae]
MSIKKNTSLKRLNTQEICLIMLTNMLRVSGRSSRQIIIRQRRRNVRKINLPIRGSPRTPWFARFLKNSARLAKTNCCGHKGLFEQHRSERQPDKHKAARAAE